MELVEQVEVQVVVQVAVQVARVLRPAELQVVIEDYLVHNMFEVEHRVAVVHKDIADHREAAVRMDTADRKVVVVRTVAVHIVAVHKVVSGHKVGKAGKGA